MQSKFSIEYLLLKFLFLWKAIKIENSFDTCKILNKLLEFFFLCGQISKMWEVNISLKKGCLIS